MGGKVTTCAIVTVLTLRGSYTCFSEVPRNLVPGSVSNMQMEMGLQLGCWEGSSIALQTSLHPDHAYPRIYRRLCGSLTLDICAVVH